MRNHLWKRRPYLMRGRRLHGWFRWWFLCCAGFAVCFRCSTSGQCTTLVLFRWDPTGGSWTLARFTFRMCTADIRFTASRRMGTGESRGFGQMRCLFDQVLTKAQLLLLSHPLELGSVSRCSRSHWYVLADERRKQMKLVDEDEFGIIRKTNKKNARTPKLNWTRREIDLWYES